MTTPNGTSSVVLSASSGVSVERKSSTGPAFSISAGETSSVVGVSAFAASVSGPSFDSVTIPDSTGAVGARVSSTLDVVVNGKFFSVVSTSDISAKISKGFSCLSNDGALFGDMGSASMIDSGEAPAKKSNQINQSINQSINLSVYRMNI